MDGAAEVLAWHRRLAWRADDRCEDAHAKIGELTLTNDFVRRSVMMVLLGLWTASLALFHRLADIAPEMDFGV